MMRLGSAFCTLWLTCLALGTANGVNVVCFFTTWDDWRNGTDKTEVAGLDPTLCTHLIYGFIDITNDGEVDVSGTQYDQPDETGRTGFQTLNAFRKRNKRLKILVSTGGWNEGSARYSKVMADPSLRSKYVKNVVNFVLRHELDGFDLNWLYPTAHGGAPEDVDNLVLFLKELRSSFDEHNLISIMSVAASEIKAIAYYDIPEISKYVHFIILRMMHHRPIDPTIGHGTPLYRAASETSSLDWSRNINNAVLYWISQEAPAEKLLLTLRFNGLFYYLNNSAEHVPGSLKSIKETEESSYISYTQICERLKSGTYTTVWDDERKVPYSYSGNEWMSYDDERGFIEKVKYVQAMGLGGVMGWCVNWDDPYGECGEPYPNLKAINRVLRESGSLPKADTTESMKLYNEAKRTCATLDIKYVRNPKDCAKFWICYETDGNDFDAEPFSCSNGLYFDTKKTACRSKDSVKCN